jgi:flagellar hook-associated protein 2
MTLSVGGQSYALTIGNANNSLQGLADAINATKSGVSASIVGQGAGVRLVVKGPSGLTNAFTLAGQAGNPPSLAAFSYDGSAASPMTLAHAAQDAKFNLDGVPYSRSTNSFSDLLSNVTFELKQAQPGVGLTMAVVRPTSAFSTALSQFVTAFNQMTTDMEAAQKSSPGDPVLATMQRQLRNFLAAPLTSDATYRSLNDIGIKTSQDGTISLDTAKFDAALATSPDAVEAIFSPVRDAGHTQLTDPGMAGAFGALASAQTIASSPINTYVNQLNSQSARITKQRLEMEKQMTDLQTRLTRKFGAMDAAVGAIKASQSYLTQQVAIWSKSGN